MTYQITTAPSYQCDGKRVPTIEVFDASGATISFCRRRHFEAKAAWIARALSTAAATQEHDMITPTININGSSIDDLIDPRLTAMDALMDAFEALKQTAPNGRDYIGNRDCWEQDRITHFDRLAKLRALREEIMSEAVYIKEQG